MAIPTESGPWVDGEKVQEVLQAARGLLIGIRWLLLCLIVVASVPFPAAAEPTFHRGMNVYFHGNDGHNPEAIDWLISHLSAMHVDHILLDIPIYIDAWDGNEIGLVFEPTALQPGADSPTEDELAALIQAAKNAGIAVVLRPLLDEGQIVKTGPNGAWRGTIQPSDLELFFRNYTALLAREWAMVENHGVTGIVIGSELNSLENSAYEPYWTQLISTLKEQGASHDLSLLYAQNWDTGRYQGYPSWFAQLDAIAMDAYLPALGLSGTPLPEEIAAALGDYIPDLQALKASAPGKPLYITEAGLTSQDADPSVLEAPWMATDASLPTDLQLQANYIAGACQFLRQATDADGQPLIDGIFWWASTVNKLDDPAKDNSFEVIGKPAEQVVTDCYAQ